MPREAVTATAGAMRTQVVMAMAGRGTVLGLIVTLLFVAGCAGRGGSARWEGPQALAAQTAERWSYRGTPGQRISTQHYLIHTTVEEDECRYRLSQLMEGALAEYRKMAPQVPLTDRPMECYVFGRRDQWSDFTRQHTGNDATIYLQINRGGYTVRDWFVAYYVGDVGTYVIAAHEGWHQYVARHFIGRLPPFLEEGMACTFERLTWEGDLPRWDLSGNANRTEALRRAIQRKQLWPLGKLIATHAGEMVNRPTEQIEAFYAQSWAFARFLWEAEDGRYRPMLQRLLADTAAGTVYDPTNSHRRWSNAWQPAAVKPVLEHYLGMDLPAIERQYQAYLRRIASRPSRIGWDGQ